MYEPDELANRIELYAKGKYPDTVSLLIAAGVSRNAVINMKKGSSPSVDKMAKIADALSCSVDYLLGRTDVVEVGGAGSRPAALPEDETVLLDRYRSCSDGGKEIIRAYALTVLLNIEKKGDVAAGPAEGISGRRQEGGPAGVGSSVGV